MAWIMSYQEVDRHPKTRKLARSLNETIPSVIGRLHLLWHWALDYAEDGDLSRYEPEDIADATMWEGDPQELYSNLVSAGFINEDGTIHDWDEYAGRLIDRRKANANKQKAWRERHSNGYVAVTQPPRSGAIEQNRTEQNSKESTCGEKTPAPVETPQIAADAASENGKEKRTRKTTKRDAMKAALDAEFGKSQTKRETSLYYQTADFLLNASPPVEPDDVSYICQQWPRYFKNATLTITCLPKWLHKLRPIATSPPKGNGKAPPKSVEVDKYCPLCGELPDESHCHCDLGELRRAKEASLAAGREDYAVTMGELLAIRRAGNLFDWLALQPTVGEITHAT